MLWAINYVEVTTYILFFPLLLKSCVFNIRIPFQPSEPFLQVTSSMTHRRRISDDTLREIYELQTRRTYFELTRCRFARVIATVEFTVM